jgi:hypothetical protein
VTIVALAAGVAGWVLFERKRGAGIDEQGNWVFYVAGD